MFITFEGGEGSGKTTQAHALGYRLGEAGREVTFTREPGGTPAGERIRELLLGADLKTSLPPKAETLLFLADRAAHVDQVIRPALDRGNLVICDRYADSTIAYQGAGRRLGMRYLAGLCRWVTSGLTPDLVIVLDVDPRDGLARARRCGDADRIEQEDLTFHDRVRDAFLHLAQARAWHNGNTRYAVFDATMPAEQIAEQVWTAVTAQLEERTSA